MKRIIFLPLLGFLLLPFHSAHSQVSFSIGPSIGLTVPTGDYGGTTVEYYYGQKYGFSSGVNVGAVVKVNTPIIRVRGAGNFSFLSNTGNAEPDKPNSSVEVKQTVFMLSVGPEFAIGIPMSPIKPYIGADFLITTFNGETNFQGVDEVSSGTHSMSSATRTGIGLGAGVEISLKRIAIDVGLRYNFHNLMGKSFVQYFDSDRNKTYANLNDDADPNFDGFNSKHPVQNSRNISTLQLNLAVLFGL